MTTPDAGGAACVPIDAGVPALSQGQIVQVLITANETEIAQGQLAQSRLADGGVDAFATRMVVEHTAANQRLTLLAQTLGVSPTPSPFSEQLQAEATQATSFLQSFPDAGFELGYVTLQVEEHAKVLFISEGVLAPQAPADGGLAQELAKERETALSHLNAATALLQSMSDAGM